MTTQPVAPGAVLVVVDVGVAGRRAAVAAVAAVGTARTSKGSSWSAQDRAARRPAGWRATGGTA